MKRAVGLEAEWPVDVTHRARMSSDTAHHNRLVLARNSDRITLPSSRWSWPDGAPKLQWWKSTVLIHQNYT